MNLDHPIKSAWDSFDRLSNREWVVKPSVPIAFFGDSNAYQASRLRIVTVGLNPSLHEFPSNHPFTRFPQLQYADRRDLLTYREALNDYFRIAPYSKWFKRSFESMLNGLGASFCGEHESTALHTDICSPIATLRTWSRLNAAERNALEEDGVQIWHDLIESLNPHLVLISVAVAHLDKIKFTKLTEWKNLHAFINTASGRARKTPYEIKYASYLVANAETKFVFGQAAQTPFGLLGKAQAHESGQIIRELT